jgi:hypothetical protein
VAAGADNLIRIKCASVPQDKSICALLLEVPL